MFDEMSVRKGLHLRQSDMVLLGKVDYGDQTSSNDEVKDGDHVLVFLFRPFLGGWSQTIGTFCTAGATPGHVLAKLILQCIIHLSNASVLVESITCDNSTTNQAALRTLGIHNTQLYFHFKSYCEQKQGRKKLLWHVLLDKNCYGMYSCCTFKLFYYLLVNIADVIASETRS